jgi:uncharacterized FlaG/YvyC family protein
MPETSQQNLFRAEENYEEAMVIASTSLTSTAAAPAAAPSHPAPAPNREVNRQTRVAVNTLNQAETAGPGREFSFSIDPKSKLPIVKIVDSNTRELIEQIPAQAIVDLARQLGQLGQESLSNPL